jgi:TonB family protein
MPSVSITGLGEPRGIPIADRVNVLVDGAPIAPACPNQMNPALSAITPTRVSKAAVLAGITLQGDPGHDILDQAAEEMIRRASPLPPLPAEMGRSHIDITFPVRYTLE